MYFGTSVMPQASLDKSIIQQRINFIRVGHLLEANYMLKEIIMLKPELSFPYVDRDIASTLLVSFYDAAHDGKELEYGTTGRVTGLRVMRSDESTGIVYGEKIFYVISWNSGK